MKSPPLGRIWCDPTTDQIQLLRVLLHFLRDPQICKPPPTTSIRGEKSRKAATKNKGFFEILVGENFPISLKKYTPEFLELVA